MPARVLTSPVKRVTGGARGGSAALPAGAQPASEPAV